MEAGKIKYNRIIIDYIYLLQMVKFSKEGLIKLFSNESITINKLENMMDESLKKYFNYKKKQPLDALIKINEVISSYRDDASYKTIEKITNECIENGIQILTPFSSELPKLFLLLKPKYRDLIFIKGKILDQDLKSFSICGSRTPTKDAIIKSRQIAKYLASKGFTLINGYAKGIDIESGLAALEAGGRYIGVLASG
ncbi:MAG: DNA-processing protein DprA, partial [Promethearchaeota archaeon]